MKNPLAAMALVALIAATPAAAAKTVRLNWTEKTPGDSDYPAMTFKITTLTINGQHWSVRASVVNRSKDTIAVQPGYERIGLYGFGLIIPETTNCGPRYGTNCGTTLAKATTTTPSFPHNLKPGRTWTGSFSGTTALPRGVLLHIAFGYFIDQRLNPQGFTWITHHATKL